MSFQPGSRGTVTLHEFLCQILRGFVEFPQRCLLKHLPALSLCPASTLRAQGPEAGSGDRDVQVGVPVPRGLCARPLSTGPPWRKGRWVSNEVSLNGDTRKTLGPVPGHTSLKPPPPSAPTRHPPTPVPYTRVLLKGSRGRWQLLLRGRSHGHLCLRALTLSLPLCPCPARTPRVHRALGPRTAQGSRVPSRVRVPC